MPAGYGGDTNARLLDPAQYGSYALGMAAVYLAVARWLSRRGLADLRSVLRLTPGTVLVLRAAGGTTTAGALPPQKLFTLGGVHGLRARPFGRFRGEQFVLGQTECTVALPHPWRAKARSGLHAIAFVDAGDAWTSAGRAWAPADRHLHVDGGLGLTTAEDNMRVYVARNLQKRHAAAVVSVRLQRPF